MARPFIMVRHGELIVFMVVAVDAQQFPVAAVGRIVVVVVIFVMHGQFAETLPFKLACAPGADVGEKLERPLSIAFLPFFRLTPQFVPDLPFFFFT